MEKTSSQAMSPYECAFAKPISKLLSIGTRRIKLINGPFEDISGSRESYRFMK